MSCAPGGGLIFSSFFAQALLPEGQVQVQVKVQGKTRMVDILQTTTAAQLECIVAVKVGVPRGIFALYRGSKPLRRSESVERRGEGIELKFRGRGGMPTSQQAR